MSVETNFTQLFDSGKVKVNTDISKLDEIMKKYYDLHDKHKKNADIRYFQGLNVTQLKYLVHLGYADPYTYHNPGCPTIMEFVGYMSLYPGYTVAGHTISNKRDDYKYGAVRITAIEKSYGPVKYDELEAFKILTNEATESYTNGYLTAWWD